MLFLDTRPFTPDAAKDKEWNRGAYLVESLGHCGACHSNRNVFGAAAKSGGDLYNGWHPEGWYAPPLNKNSPAPTPWTVNALVNYLIDGWDKQHGIAAGPMLPIVNDLYNQSEDDVFAIGAYVSSLKGGELPKAEQDAKAADALKFAENVEWGNAAAPAIPNDAVMQAGAKVFEEQCAMICHKIGGKPALLALSTTVNAPDPNNLIKLVFWGIEPAPRGVLDRNMPARAIQISDEQMTALAQFVRARFSKQPAWTGVADAVKAIRAERKQ
jgi:mono/diheme cytochrome c family protein